MTTPSVTTAPVPTEAPAVDEAACPVCPHPLAAHDTHLAALLPGHRRPGRRHHDPRMRLPVERERRVRDHAGVTAAPGSTDVDRSDPAGRAWVDRAVAAVEADARRSADTHLLVYPLPPEWGVDLYLKDESTHPTGSLKHRLARSLFLYGLCSGQITEGSTVVEASSGSTAVSEAYFARMLGLPFVAVMPATTSPEKIALIEFHGGRCHFVRARRRTCTRRPAGSPPSAAATTWTSSPTPSGPPTGGATTTSPSRSSSQLALERHPVPEWVVVGAGTGGTSATIGRYLRYRRLPDPAGRRRPGELRLLPGLARRRPADGRPAGPPASRASAGRGWSRPSCRPSSTG